MHAHAVDGMGIQSLPGLVDTKFRFTALYCMCLLSSQIWRASRASEPCMDGNPAPSVNFPDVKVPINSKENKVRTPSCSMLPVPGTRVRTPCTRVVLEYVCFIFYVKTMYRYPGMAIIINTGTRVLRIRVRTGIEIPVRELAIAIAS